MFTLMFMFKARSGSMYVASPTVVWVCLLWLLSITQTCRIHVNGFLPLQSF